MSRHCKKKSALTKAKALFSFKLNFFRLLRLVPQDVVVHSLEVLDGRDMAVNVGDIGQTVVKTVDTAGRVVDVKERRVIPHFLVVGVNGVAGFGRILELIQHRHAAAAILIHGTAVAVRTAVIVFDRAFDDGANVGDGRITPAVFKRRRGGAQEALPFTRVVVEGIFPPPELGFRLTIEQRPAEITVVVVTVHSGGQTDLLHVACAGDSARFVAGFRQRRQQHGGQNRDDRDDDQQFNQCEGQDFFHFCFPFLIKGPFSQYLYQKTFNKR